MKSINWILIAFFGLVIIATVFFVMQKQILQRNASPSLGDQDSPAEVSSTTVMDSTDETVVFNGSSDLQRAINAFSIERTLEFLTKLTQINPHSGWRTGGTQGEMVALNLVEEELNTLLWLKDQGMSIERETFNIFTATQDHSTRVFITTDTETAEVEADSVRGNRNDLSATIRMDSDGEIGDHSLDPVSVAGEIVLIDSKQALDALRGTSLENKIALVNYQLVDNGIITLNDATKNAVDILKLSPAGIVLVTRNSFVVGESHGSFVGDGGGGFQPINQYAGVPMLFIEIENLAKFGITSWDDMHKINSLAMEWDVDVINPASSGNLIVHIPGRRGGKPVLISAHIDSPNSPGALDDGSGSAILMEIAQTLNEEKLVPSVDLYLVWYGSEEVALNGSAYFASTHSELLNQLQANLQIDCLSRPLEGLPSEISLESGFYNGESVETDPFAQYLMKQAEQLNEKVTVSYWPFSSDNGVLSAYGVSNLNMIYLSDEMNETYGGVWYAGHFHDPYDTIELAREMQDVLLKMGQLAISTAFIPTEDQVISPHNNQYQALFLSTYTEESIMSLPGSTEFVNSVMNAGYEVNNIPYGQEISAKDLEGVELLVVLPPFDLPATEKTIDVYDVQWKPETAEIINDYVQTGGTVVVANNARRLRLFDWIAEENEDWADLNTLTDQWGVHYTSIGELPYDLDAEVNLGEFSFELTATVANFVNFNAPVDSIRASAAGETLLAEVNVGSGKVIVLGELLPLRSSSNGNLLNKELVDAILHLPLKR